MNIKKLRIGASAKLINARKIITQMTIFVRVLVNISFRRMIAKIVLIIAVLQSSLKKRDCMVQFVHVKTNVTIAFKKKFKHLMAIEIIINVYN